MTSAETKGYLTTWSKRTGIAVEVWALPTAELPPEVVTAIRAGLDNVERSGGATHVSIAVTTGRNGLRLTISDNGKGTAAIEGVAAMRSAFARIGGTLSVHTVPGEGTTVQAIAYGSRHTTPAWHSRFPRGARQTSPAPCGRGSPRLGIPRPGWRRRG